MENIYVVYSNGCIGYVESICTCDSCKERGEIEIIIHHLSGGYLACVKHHELFDNNIILNAGHSIEELSEQHSDIEMARLFVDMYHDELLKVKGEYSNQLFARKDSNSINKVFLDKKGKVFVNGNEITDVSSISINTTWTGSEINISFNGDYKSEFISDVKTHSLDECVKE